MGRSILITGGTGSLGNAIVAELLQRNLYERIVVLSRDEYKQSIMAQKFLDPRMRFFLGDVRDVDRLRLAFKGCETVLHAAALKQVPAGEENPFEFVQTNVLGTQNVVRAAVDCGVRKVLFVSTDKASSPVNLYGATKLVAERVVISGNIYDGTKTTRLSVARYGNVVGSRGSVVEVFRRLGPTGILPITDPRMTRFWITLPEATRFVLARLEEMKGEELFIPRIPSARILDLAEVMYPEAKRQIVGARPGEKLHEELIPAVLGCYVQEYPTHYVVHPTPVRAEPLPAYTSDTNEHWLTKEELANLVRG